MRKKRSEAALLRISAIAIGVLVGAWIVIAGARALGAELIPILAGIGVGGLAVVLAAQTTMADFIGGLILFVNKPVRVGDFCRYGEATSPARVRYVSLGSYSKDVAVFACFTCRQEDDFLAIHEDLLLRVEDIVNEAGTGFAFSSQTAYLAQGAGLDARRREAAERDIQRRRATGKLPFPEFEEEERKRLENLLDYPPQGSPDYTPRGGSQ